MVKIYIVVFLVMTMYSLIGSYQSFKGICLHFTLEMSQAGMRVDCMKIGEFISGE
jgi:hypothetical protein